MWHLIRNGARLWVFFVGLGLLAGIVGGCGRGKSEQGKEGSAENPYSGLKLSFAVPGGKNLLLDWQLPVTEWNVQLGTECRLREYPMPEGFQEFQPAVVQGTDHNSEVMFIPWSAVPALAARDALAEIPEPAQHSEQLNWLGVFPGLRNRVAKVARKPRLVPISCPILVCYYRQDLLEQAGLAPPKTWSEYQSLLESLETWAPGLKAVEPWGESFRATMFLARSAAVAKHSEQFSFCFDFSTGDPLIANPGFVASLKMATEAVARMPAEVKNYLPGDCRREILEGRAAMAIAYETDLSQTVSRGENLQIGIFPLPGATRVFNTAIDEWVDMEDETVHRVTLTGFTGWALGVSSHLEPAMNSAAWELVRYMAIDQLPASYPSSLISPCRDSQTANPSTWTGAELTTSEAEQYVSVVAEALRSDQLVMELPLIGQAQFRESLSKGLTRALEGTEDAEAVLQSLRQEWLAISRKLGKEEVAKSYQRSHQ